MKKEYRLSVLGISLIFQLFAYIQSRLIPDSVSISPNWFSQFPYLLVILITASVAAGLTERINVIVILLIIRSIIFIITGLPLGAYKEIELILLLSILIETSLYLQYPLSFYLSTGTIVATLFFQQPLTAWGDRISALPLHDLLMLALVSISFTAAFMVIRILLDNLGRARDNSKRLNYAVTQLSKANVDFQQYIDVIQEQSTIEERNRISREIHDTVGYTLTNIKMMMEAAMRVANSDQNKLFHFLLQAREQAHTGLVEIRSDLRALRNLRYTKLEGVRAIQKIVETFEDATGVKVKVEYTNLPFFIQEPADTIIQRVIQEGMTNSFQHGQATEIQIVFFATTEDIHLFLRDNGRGSTHVIEGIGISGMKERLREAKGTLEAKNIDDGFELSVTIPVKEVK